MKSVILAAGRGTRLGPQTDECPKPLLEIAPGRSILRTVIEGVRDAGIREIILVVGHLSNRIREAFGDGGAMGLSIQYIEQTELNGTGGALRLARGAVDGDIVLGAFGDILASPSNYKSMVDDYRAAPVPILLGLNRMDDPYAGAAVYFDPETRRVGRIVEKPPKGTSTTPWNSAGVFILENGIFDRLDRLKPSPRGEYEWVDAVHRTIADGLPVRAHPLEGFWSDVGTPEDLENVRRMMAEHPESLFGVERDSSGTGGPNHE